MLVALACSAARRQRGLPRLARAAWELGGRGDVAEPFWAARPIVASASAVLLSQPSPRPSPPCWAAGPVLLQQRQQQQQQQHQDHVHRTLHTPAGHGGEDEEHPPPPPAKKLDPLPPWLTSLLPAAALPYAALARLDKPAGTALLLWPGLWAIAAAAPPGCGPDARLTALFAVGAALLRGAGCTVNDLWDRDLDARVSRTAGRPLACGAVSVPGAVGFLAAQLAAGAAVLWQFDGPTVALGVAALPLVFAYPLAKRALAWPQAVLGVTFNWGALLGWAAAVGAGVVGGGGCGAAAAGPPAALLAAGWAAAASSPVPLLLYAGGFAWTQWYDTVYAYQDIRDDEAAGVKSSARTLRRVAGGKEKAALVALAAGAGGLLTSAGAAAGLGPPFYAGMAAVAGLSARQFAALDLTSPASCGAAFRAHAGLGGLVWVAIVAGRVCGG